MSSTFTLCDPVDFFTFVAGLFLLLKKLSQMDRHQSLRTVVMTAVFSAIPLYFLLGFTLGPLALEPFTCWDAPLCMDPPE